MCTVSGIRNTHLAIMFRPSGKTCGAIFLEVLCFCMVWPSLYVVVV